MESGADSEPQASISSAHNQTTDDNRDKDTEVKSASQTDSDNVSSAANPGVSETTKVNTTVIKDKVTISLRAVGGAPILKQRVLTVDSDRPLSSVIQNTKYRLRNSLDSDKNLFFFVNQAFAPSPDQILRNLYECFGTDGKLILYYCTTVAWG